jgi:hypothetical protein
MRELDANEIEELLARYELGTYLDGLRDALKSTKPEIKRAIKIIVESETEI